MAVGGFLKDFICTFCAQNGLLNSIHDRKQGDMTCIEDSVSSTQSRRTPQAPHSSGSSEWVESCELTRRLNISSWNLTPQLPAGVGTYLIRICSALERVPLGSQDRTLYLVHKIVNGTNLHETRWRVQNCSSGSSAKCIVQSFKL